MGRLEHLLKYVELDGQGIEIAPYFNPAIPKKSGRKVLVMDVYPAEKLRELAELDPYIESKRIEQIEHVDFVGDASSIGDIVAANQMSGRLDYIVSSHNFEHLPNPIKFLRGAEQALTSGGVLSMAVPDYRACFDHFRMPTRVSDWLRAYYDNHDRPSPEMVFDAFAYHSDYMKGTRKRQAASLWRGKDRNFVPSHQILYAYDLYHLHRLGDFQEYQDVHCSVFFPESFELILLDLKMLGLMSLDILEITRTRRHEFFVHLVKSPSSSPRQTSITLARRQSVMRRMSKNIGSAPYLRSWIYRRARSIFG